MRLISTFTGLLSIIGAAFLFATAHAMIAKPVSLAPPDLKTGSEGGTFDPSRDRRSPQNIESESTQTDSEIESDATPAIEQPEDTVVSTEVAPSDTDALLDAAVPEGMLTLRDAYTLWEQGAYFLDARHEHEFEAGHIQYATWLPATLFDTDSDRAFATVDTMPPDATVVIYCVGGECDASKNTANRLQQIGFSDLRVMGVGYGEWREAGLPTTEGSEP